MSILKNIFILIVIIINFGCNKNPTQLEFELREDLSETEFKEAILGKWESAYEKQYLMLLDQTQQYPPEFPDMSRRTICYF